ARAIVDDQSGERRLRVERGGLAGEQYLDLALQYRVDRRSLHRREGLGHAQRPRQMRGVKRQRPALAWDRLGAGLGEDPFRDHALSLHSLEYGVSREARGIGMAVRAQTLR